MLAWFSPTDLINVPMVKQFDPISLQLAVAVQLASYPPSASSPFKISELSFLRMLKVIARLQKL